MDRRRVALLTLAYGWLAFMGFAVMGARASLVTDIPNQLNTALFDGQSILGAQLVLSAAILTSAGLAMGVAKLDFVGTLVVLLAISFALVGLGWMPYWVAIFECMLIGGMWAAFLRNAYQGGTA